MRGEFFWLRLEGGVLKQVLAVRALRLDAAAGASSEDPSRDLILA